MDGSSTEESPRLVDTLKAILPVLREIVLGPGSTASLRPYELASDLSSNKTVVALFLRDAPLPSHYLCPVLGK